MGPRTLTEEEWLELREALAAWRTVKKIITGGFVVVIAQTSALIGWGMSVESRFASAGKVDEATRESLTDIKATQAELLRRVDRVAESVAEYRGLHNGVGGYR